MPASTNNKRTLLLVVTSGLVLMLQNAVAAFEPLPDTAPAPKDNPTTPAKVELGKQLFFDPRLSADGTVSCNSCHNVMSSGTDNRAVSVGVDGKRGGRSAPTVWNAAFLSTQFWDGRAATLEDQAKGPILNPIEMGMPHQQAAVDRIASISGYRDQFTKIFGGDNPVNYDNIAKAIAAYERTLITPNSPLDKYLKGDKTALNDDAKQGMQLFAELGCNSCHSGPAFAGPATLSSGQGFFQKFPTFDSEFTAKHKLDEDKGRFEVTKNAEDKNLWRVPTLRNIALTAPYFHNGSVKTLDEAVRVMAKAQLNKELDDKQVAKLVAFLNSLTGEFPSQTMARLPETTKFSTVGAEE